MIDAARVLLKRLGHGEIAPKREVGSLSAAGQQMCRWRGRCPTRPS